MSKFAPSVAFSCSGRHVWIEMKVISHNAATNPQIIFLQLSFTPVGASSVVKKENGFLHPQLSHSLSHDRPYYTASHWPCAHQQTLISSKTLHLYFTTLNTHSSHQEKWRREIFTNKEEGRRRGRSANVPMCRESLITSASKWSFKEIKILPFTLRDVGMLTSVSLNEIFSPLWIPFSIFQVTFHDDGDIFKKFQVQDIFGIKNKTARLSVWFLFKVPVKG